MNFLTLVGMELRKTRRCGIGYILLAATVILWVPSILHIDLNFGMEAEGISPEHNFFIQGFLAMTWFLFPASMVVGCVLLGQTERTNRGILRMLTLPVDTVRLCLAKFAVLLVLAAVQILMMTGMYYISALIGSEIRDYNFVLPFWFVAGQTGGLFLSSIPMIAFFWMLSVWIRTPIFSIGLGLASIVPSVLVINTKLWFAYPMAYPLFVVTAQYGRLAAKLDTAQVEWVPWIPVAVAVTAACLGIACYRFGREERI